MFSYNLNFLQFEKHVFADLSSDLRLRASFTKQGKLARECNSKTALMDVEISAGDLLTTTLQHQLLLATIIAAISSAK